MAAATIDPTTQCGCCGASGAAGPVCPVCWSPLDGSGRSSAPDPVVLLGAAIAVVALAGVVAAVAA